MEKATPGFGVAFPVCLGWLEIQMQGHLDLAWAADGVLDDAQAGGAAIEVVDRFRSAATGGQHGAQRPFGWEGIVSGVLRDLVAGDIETGGVGEVEDVEGVLHVVPVADL